MIKKTQAFHIFLFKYNTYIIHRIKNTDQSKQTVVEKNSTRMYTKHFSIFFPNLPPNNPSNHKGNIGVASMNYNASSTSPTPSF